MRYVTSSERMAKAEGREEGRLEMLREAILELLADRFGLKRAVRCSTPDDLMRS